MLVARGVNAKGFLSSIFRRIGVIRLLKKQQQQIVVQNTE